MIRTLWLRVTVLAFVALGASDSFAANRAFVASTGSDGNPCSRTAPCRKVSAAIAATDPGGEVVILDSGVYGSFSVAKAISITAPAGVYAGIVTGGSAPAIVLNAGPTDTVRLRGLTITGTGTGDGIDFQAGGTLELEGVQVGGFSAPNKVGLMVQAPGTVLVHDSTFRDNYHGIVVETTTGTARLSLDRVQLIHNASVGLYALDGCEATITNSVVSTNNYGIDAQVLSTTSHAGANVHVEGCQVSNNTLDGIVIGGYPGLPAPPPLILVSSSTITGNGGVGLHGMPSFYGNLVSSRQNNTVLENGGGNTQSVDAFAAK